jgi:hypothetical protein
VACFGLWRLEAQPHHGRARWRYVTDGSDLRDHGNGEMRAARKASSLEFRQRLASATLDLGIVFLYVMSDTTARLNPVTPAGTLFHRPSTCQARSLCGSSLIALSTASLMRRAASVCSLMPWNGTIFP